MELRTEIPTSGTEFLVLDTVFRIGSPDGDPTGDIWLNIDIQKREVRGFELSGRQQVYPAALLLDQFRKFGEVDYSMLSRCYSVWVILEPLAELRNTVDRRGFGTGTAEDGKGPQWKSLINVASYRLGDPAEKKEGGVLRLLNLIFSGDIPLNERQKMIEEEFGLTIGLSTLRRVKKSMSMTMEYGRTMFSEGKEEGREEEKLSIAKIMLSTGSEPEYVTTCTGLSKEEILRLRNGTN